jgi:transcriptional regulator with XRE-family HTH domain
MAADAQKQGGGVTVFGGLIKRLRKDRKMTLQELGDQTGLSPSFLSLVERNKAVPSIVSLVNIARAFEVSIDEFIRPAAASGVLHRHDEPDRLEIDSPIGFIRLSASLPDQKLDAFIFEIPPGTVLPREKANGEFFYYLLSGALKVTAGRETYELRPGDSVHFDASNGYLAENPTDETVKVLWVGNPPLLTGTPP